MSTSTIRPIVISGPSGGGKSTILTRAMKEYPDVFAFSVSNTTRQPRSGEEHGVHYWFTPHDKMEQMIEKDKFLEYAVFGSNTYGTSKRAVEDVQKTGKICVLDVELQGVKNIKASHLNAKFILIQAPSLVDLEARLRARNTETESSLAARLKHAQEDSEAINKDPLLFDTVIINDNLEKAYNEFILAIEEELRLVQARHTA
uniref:Guanylate kinase n=1 Tax=Rhabditophanes sp. KR3021 TaxID=114890 RepID=A0AC35TL81_9BILA